MSLSLSSMQHGILCAADLIIPSCICMIITRENIQVNPNCVLTADSTQSAWE